MPCPCVMQYKQAQQESLALLAVKKQQKELNTEYGVIPLTEEDLTRASIIQKEHVLESEPFPSLSFQYATATSPQANPIFTDVFLGLGGIAVVFMPGANTPVCSSMHLPSLINKESLLALKEAGINFLLIVTKDTPDVLCGWVRYALEQEGLPSDIIPNQLPEQSLAKIALNDKFPVIIPFSDQSLTLTNMHGLVTTGRLGLTAHRGYSVFLDNKFSFMVKPTDSGRDACSMVIGSKMLSDIAEYKSLQNTIRAKL